MNVAFNNPPNIAATKNTAWRIGRVSKEFARCKSNDAYGFYKIDEAELGEVSDLVRVLSFKPKLEFTDRLQTPNPKHALNLWPFWSTRAGLLARDVCAAQKDRLIMAMFKNPDFKDRMKLAAEAKQKALEKLKAKPAVDPAIVAERIAAQAARDAAIAEKSAAKLAARQAIADEKAAAKALANAPKPQPKVATAAEMKAARDARYAARKMK
jgi:Family of unknown function (DUF6481)